MALMKLKVGSWFILSGTLAHNKWVDMGSYLDYLKGHPFTEEEDFATVFQGETYAEVKDPTPDQIALLQRFLQALTIMRSGAILTLPPCIRLQYPVTLEDAHAQEVANMTMDYIQLSGMQEDDDDECTLGLAIEAQVHSLHPLLVPDEMKKVWRAGERFQRAAKRKARKGKGKGKAKPPTGDDEYDPKGPDWNPENEVDEAYEEAATKERANLLDVFVHEEHESAAAMRAKWLTTLSRWIQEQVFDSPHVVALVEMLYNLIKKRPEDKIIVFSQYLRYPDIINKGLRVRHKVECLRFDGTILPKCRTAIEKKFLEDPLWQIMFITAGCGSVGLNLTAANIVVLCEE
ncbi:hypothetical protein J4E93_006377 [Alternaria ventricosa]|uniref:uncharacterized protein n=1 Tax=Alternaria ventricosa TaxID=1187951 RepID=UPI0020C4A272|nr:uncharacterized protein J4E93_006377 [Alternaria ventricosa]KAI4644474.1 hypothetical protein J4E93_006377 [Alternaria ventricosa]